MRLMGTGCTREQRAPLLVAHLHQSRQFDGPVNHASARDCHRVSMSQQQEKAACAELRYSDKPSRAEIRWKRRSILVTLPTCLPVCTRMSTGGEGDCEGGNSRMGQGFRLGDLIFDAIQAAQVLLGQSTTVQQSRHGRHCRPERQRGQKTNTAETSHRGHESLRPHVPDQPYHVSRFAQSPTFPRTLSCDALDWSPIGLA